MLPDAVEAIHDLKRDGVDVKILTGDNPLVASALCERLGFHATAFLVGDQVEKMTDRALSHAAEQYSIFARVSPAQKNRIILALRHRGHVVGFLGDGINDAPSLHAADVGISVASATDVAREAADIVLTKPGLRVLHQGILEGRRTYGNVLKYLLMGTSSNFGNMLSMALASGVLPFLPMLPTQLLLNNFLYDVSQVAIPGDIVDEAILRAPRRLDMHMVTRFMFSAGAVSSLFDFLTFFVLLKIFHAGEALFHTGWFVESLATQTLVLLVIRTLGSPLTQAPSRSLLLSIMGVVLIGIALPYSWLANGFGFVPLPASYVLFAAVATTAYLSLINLIKRWLIGPSLPTRVLQRSETVVQGRISP
jgi:Mg2+-importing ATPase